MKTCPRCRHTYEDDSLVFCLQDGARLVAESGTADPQATWHLPPPPPPTEPAPRSTSPHQSTITARPEQFENIRQQFAPSDISSEKPERSSALPWILAIVFVLGVSAVLIAWIVTRSRGDNVATRTSPTTSAIPTPSPVATAEAKSSSVATATPDRSTKEDKPTQTPRPTQERAKPAFTVMNNISFSGGSRITYYPRASFGQCEADCAANASCRAFTWIRPGAYNPGDSAMCYLMASVTGPVSHPCCISAKKN